MGVEDVRVRWIFHVRSDRWPKWACRRAPAKRRGTARTLAGSVRYNAIHYTGIDAFAPGIVVRSTNPGGISLRTIVTRRIGPSGVARRVVCETAQCGFLVAANLRRTGTDRFRAKRL